MGECGGTVEVCPSWKLSRGTPPRTLHLHAGHAVLRPAPAAYCAALLAYTQSLNTNQPPTCAFMLAPSMYTCPPWLWMMRQISSTPSSYTPCVEG